MAAKNLAVATAKRTTQPARVESKACFGCSPYRRDSGDEEVVVDVYEVVRPMITSRIEEAFRLFTNAVGHARPFATVAVGTGPGVVCEVVRTRTERVGRQTLNAPVLEQVPSYSRDDVIDVETTTRRHEAVLTGIARAEPYRQDGIWIARAMLRMGGELSEQLL